MPHSEIGKAPSLRVLTISARRCAQSAHGTPLFKRLCISNESFWPRRSTGTHTALALTASEGRFSADSDSTYMPSKREISTVVNRVALLSNIGVESGWSGLSLQVQIFGFNFANLKVELTMVFVLTSCLLPSEAAR